jgi:hypothetical protein
VRVGVAAVGGWSAVPGDAGAVLELSRPHCVFCFLARLPYWVVDCPNIVQYNVHSVSAQAPGPEEVNWPTLWEGFRGRNIRSLLVAIPIGIMIIFPIGIFAGAQQLTRPLAFCSCLSGILQCAPPSPSWLKQLLMCMFLYCRQCLAADPPAVWLPAKHCRNRC